MLVASFGSGAIQSLTTIGSRVFFAVERWDARARALDVRRHGRWNNDGQGHLSWADQLLPDLSDASASGDGFSDILFQNTNGQAAIWEMNGLNQIPGGSQLVGPNPGSCWRAVGV